MQAKGEETFEKLVEMGGEVLGLVGGKRNAHTRGPKRAECGKGRLRGGKVEGTGLVIDINDRREEVNTTGQGPGGKNGS